MLVQPVLGVSKASFFGVHNIYNVSVWYGIRPSPVSQDAKKRVVTTMINMVYFYGIFSVCLLSGHYNITYIIWSVVLSSFCTYMCYSAAPHPNIQLINESFTFKTPILSTWQIFRSGQHIDFVESALVESETPQALLWRVVIVIHLLGWLLPALTKEITWTRR